MEQIKVAKMTYKQQIQKIENIINNILNTEYKEELYNSSLIAKKILKYLLLHKSPKDIIKGIKKETLESLEQLLQQEYIIEKIAQIITEARQLKRLKWVDIPLITEGLELENSLIKAEILPDDGKDTYTVLISNAPLINKYTNIENAKIDAVKTIRQLLIIALKDLP